MVYNWDDKEGECYRLYVEEKKSLDEVIAYWEVRGFTPRYVTARLNVWIPVHFRRLCYTSDEVADDDNEANERFRRSSRYRTYFPKRYCAHADGS
jgi:hypothetical protein